MEWLDRNVATGVVQMYEVKHLMGICLDLCVASAYEMPGEMVRSVGSKTADL